MARQSKPGEESSGHLKINNRDHSMQKLLRFIFAFIVRWETVGRLE